MNFHEVKFEKPSNLLKLFEFICTVSENDPTEVCKKIKLKSRQVIDLESNLICPNVSEKICDFFEITPEEFISFDVNLDWIKEKKLPGKYFNSLGSTIRTSLPPLTYIRDKFGEKCFQYFLRKLRISQDILKNPSLEISKELLADIMNLASDLGLASSDFFMMGQQITKIYENKELMQGFKEIARPDKILEKLFSEIMIKYESNFDYRIIGLTSSSIKVEVEAKELRRSELHKEIIDNSFVNLYRQGGCVAHVQDFCKGIAWVKNLASVHHGASVDQFEIVYS